MIKNKQKIIVVLGPTAAGKSDLAIQIAKDFNGEIISADSRQIYKSLDIASNKITKEAMHGIPHHLLNIVKPDQDYSLYNWQQDTFGKIKEILANKKTPIIAGGTGLYICSIIQNYDLDPKTPSRRECPYDFIVLGLNPDREELYNKINQRVAKMLANGSIDEVKQIYKKYSNKKLMALSGIGYKQIIEYLDNKVSLAETIDNIKQATRNYAKRQLTWFRRMEKQGIRIHWNQNKSQLKKLLANFLEK